MRNRWKVCGLEFEANGEEKLFSAKSDAISFAQDWVLSGWERAAWLMRRAKPGKAEKAWEKVAEFTFAAGSVITTECKQRRRSRTSRRQPRSSAEMIDIALEHAGLRKREAAEFRQCLLKLWGEAVGRGRPIETPTGTLLVHNLREARKRSVSAFGKQSPIVHSQPTRLSFRAKRSLVFEPPNTETISYPHSSDYYTQRPLAPPRDATRVIFIRPPGWYRPPSRTR